MVRMAWQQQEEDHAHLELQHKAKCGMESLKSQIPLQSIVTHFLPGSDLLSHWLSTRFTEPSLTSLL